MLHGPTLCSQRRHTNPSPPLLQARKCEAEDQAGEVERLRDQAMALQDANEQLRAQAVRARDDNMSLASEVDELKAELARMTAQKDAAQEIAATCDADVARALAILGMIGMREAGA